MYRRLHIAASRLERGKLVKVKYTRKSNGKLGYKVTAKNCIA
jgi:hypothetical protein